MNSSLIKKNQYAIGRRKSAIAKVKLLPGTGEIKINKSSAINYLKNLNFLKICTSPLTILGLNQNYNLIIKVKGGGLSGQTIAIRLAIARVLASLEITNRKILKKAGFLTRDSRIKERRKYGLKKARKASQYSKR